MRSGLGDTVNCQHHHLPFENTKLESFNLGVKLDMGLSKKHHQVEGVIESEGKKWVIAGIAIRAPLRSISTKPREEYAEEHEEPCSTTPTAKESRIPERLACPAAPRKRRPARTCHYGGVREFFTPPDLESVFMRHVEGAN
ncbi:hypothetical protein RJ639_035694 [Escallonia herrerae]|uniref:Uncharacterized protein n=1 Tax=Escallonia herrerae TaxID=1293975 RepID=A0AA88WXN1_9ASTE|nr:hypothetical protein RJ639_035694 [Escallonia herrerae]